MKRGKSVQPAEVVVVKREPFPLEYRARSASIGEAVMDGALERARVDTCPYCEDQASTDISGPAPHAGPTEADLVDPTTLDHVHVPIIRGDG